MVLGGQDWERRLRMRIASVLLRFSNVNGQHAQERPDPPQPK